MQQSAEFNGGIKARRATQEHTTVEAKLLKLLQLKLYFYKWL